MILRWEITIGGGYGSYIFEGTEEEAEQERKRKARYERAIARKRLLEVSPQAIDSTASPSEAAAVQGPGLIPGGRT